MKRYPGCNIQEAEITKRLNNRLRRARMTSEQVLIGSNDNGKC